MHANLYGHILTSIFQDGGNPFPVTRLPVLSSVTHSSRHTLLLPTLHSYGSRQVYIRQRRITGFHVVQETTLTHAHEYRLLGASCVSHGNATIICYEETFRELGAVKLSPSANRKCLRYENKPRAGASSIVACLVLTEFRRMF